MQQLVNRPKTSFQEYAVNFIAAALILLTSFVHSSNIKPKQVLIITFNLSEDGYDMQFDIKTVEAMFGFRENITESDILNPYAQPNENLVNSYGCGDVDQDGYITWDDYNEIIDYAPQTDFADIDGDGVMSSEDDAFLLSQFLNDEIPYLPGHWNSLQTAEERLDWIDKMLEIDTTDEIPYHSGNVEERWISGNYATQIHLNFWGYDGDDIHPKYSQDYLGRFNLPVYEFIYWDPDTGLGHGAAGVLVGDDSSNIFDWAYIEPQDDGLIRINQGVLNFLADKDFCIAGIEVFDDGQGSPDMPTLLPILCGHVDENGNYTLGYLNPDLILVRPENMPVLLDVDHVNILQGYELGNNYPNPFNPSTVIHYMLPKAEYVSVIVYELNGTIVETVVNKFHNAGNHEISFTMPTGYASGIYFYRIKTDSGFIQTGKMTYLK